MCKEKKFGIYYVWDYEEEEWEVDVNQDAR